MLTVEALSTLPTVAAYLGERHSFITKEKGRVFRADAPRRLTGPPEEIEQFGLDVEMKGRRERLEYYIARQPAGGATVAARLLPGNDLAAVERDVERMVRSVRLLAGAPAIKPVPVPPPK